MIQILNGEICVLVGNGCPKGRSGRQRHGRLASGWDIAGGFRAMWGGAMKKGVRKNRNSEHCGQVVDTVSCGRDRGTN